jgi:hypothetical protein
MFISRIAGLVAVTALFFTQSTLAAPVPIVADLVDVESSLVKRAGEEFFFRFEDPSVATAGANILPLAARNGAKNFDDQAYKFISTDAAKVTRSKISGRVAAIYVLPAGTRAAIAKAAKDFEVERDAKRAADFVVKDNEPGDVGINGVANAGKALNDFRAKVIRTVVKQTSAKAGGKATFVTITKGKASNTASQADQKVLSKFT